MVVSASFCALASCACCGIASAMLSVDPVVSEERSENVGEADVDDSESVLAFLCSECDSSLVM